MASTMEIALRRFKVPSLAVGQRIEGELLKWSRSLNP